MTVGRFGEGDIILPIMTERPVEVVVDEAISEPSGMSFLEVELVVDGNLQGRVSFNRKASPRQISDTLHETGCFIKYEEGDANLPEDERNEVGDLFIQASYKVPGLENR